MNKRPSAWRGTAIVIILLGLSLISGNLLFLTKDVFRAVLRYWPMAFAGIGISRMLSERAKQSYQEGSVYIAIGIFLQCATLDWLPGGFTMYWPVMSLIWGVWLLLVKPKPKQQTRDECDLIETLDVREYFQSGKFVLSENAPVNGSLAATASILTVDISRGSFLPERASVELDCFFSYVKLIVPSFCIVRNETTGLFGKIERKKADEEDTERANGTLKLQGSVSFGFVRIEKRDIKHVRG